MKTEKNMRKGFGLAGKIAMFCIGLVSLGTDLVRIRAGNPAKLSVYRKTMPVPKELNRNETAEIRCELKVRAILTVRSIRSVISSMTGKVPETDNGLEFAE